MDSLSGMPLPSTTSCFHGISSNGGSISHGSYCSTARQNRARSRAEVAIGPRAPSRQSVSFGTACAKQSRPHTDYRVHAVVGAHESCVWHAADRAFQTIQAHVCGRDSLSASLVLTSAVARVATLTIDPPMSVPMPKGLPCTEINALSPPLLPPGVSSARERLAPTDIDRQK